MRFITSHLYIHSALLILITLPGLAQATQYNCVIKNVSEMNQNGYFVRHGWSANYMNREFTVDRDTGRILNTTALKQRLSNANAEYKPQIINSERPDTPFRVFTHFADSGNYALLEIRDNQAYADSPQKPYFYHTDIGMILSGTCTVIEITTR